MAQLRSGRPEAAAAVWHWDRPGVAAASASSLRLRGVIQGAVGSGVALLLYRFVSPHLGIGAAVVAGTILLAALLSPTGAYAALHRLFAWTGQLIGRALTWMLLVPMFYLVFLPFGLLFRRHRRDRMRRFYEPGSDSYWESHDQAVATAGPRERPY